MKTKDLVLIAMYVALYAVLEYVSRFIGILQMPQGGSVSLSVIPLILASYHLGLGKSLIVAVLSFIVKFMIKAPVMIHPIQFLTDYIVAFGAYSLSSLIPSPKVGKMELPLGVIVANFVRFMSHNISGWFFFSEYYTGNVLKGVMVYNATYMIPTTILSFIIVMIIKPRLQTQFK